MAVYLWRIAPWWDRRGGGWNIPRPVAASSDTPLSSTTPTSRRVPRPPPAPSRGRAVSGDSQGEAVLLRKQDLRGVSQVRPRSSGLLPGECIDGASPPRWELTGRGTETLPLLSLASPGKHPSSTRCLFQSLGNCVLQNPGYPSSLGKTIRWGHSLKGLVWIASDCRRTVASRAAILLFRPLRARA